MDQANQAIEPRESSPAPTAAQEQENIPADKLNDELSAPSDFVSRMRHTTAHVLAQAVREFFP